MDRIAKLNAAQITAKDSESWHNDYKDSAYIFAGGLSFELTEGDVVCIFSQYGEILDINFVRDKKTGNSKGFAFLRYEDQRSTILAVDNFNGTKVLGRTLKVDHVSEYKQPKRAGENAEDWVQDPRASMNVAPVALLNPEQRAAANSIGNDDQVIKKEEREEDYTKGIDPEDPMFDYLVSERREAALAKKKKSGSRHRDSDDRERRHRSRRHRSRSPRSRRTRDDADDR